MNRIKFITNLIGILLCLVSSYVPKASAHVLADAAFRNFDNANLSEDIIAERIRNLQRNVNMKVTREVSRNILMYTKYYRKDSEVLLGKVAIYFPLFEAELRRQNLPDELKYLAIVESNLKPTALSRVGAAGLWQFMKGTARMYDLMITGVVDERRDPQKSTEAAVKYLSDLHKQFGDWTLAIAAYNCGPGTVRKAIKRAHSVDYWKLRPFLPKETREYVPKFIAANYLMNYYHAHGLEPREASSDLIYTTSTRVYDKIRFSDVSNKTGADFHLIKQLNPAYIKNYIPSNDGRFSLTLPEQYMKDYISLLDKSEEIDELIVEEVATVEIYLNVPKAKAPELAVESGMPNTMPESKSENDSLDKLLFPSKNEIPVQGNDDSGEIMDLSKKSKVRFEYYKLSVDESLYDVADKNDDIKIEDLFILNQYSPENLPKPGTIIKLRKL